MSSKPAEHPPGPDHGHEAAKGGDPKVDKMAADTHAKIDKASGGALEKPKDAKEAEHAAPETHETKHEEPKKPEGLTKRIYNSSGEAASKTAGFAGNTISNAVRYGPGLAVAGGAVATGSALSALPIIGKIPYLPELAQAIQNGLVAGSNYLGMNTGAAATNSVLGNPLLAAMPNLGPAVLGAAGLWGLGKLNEKITGHKSGGGNFFGTMWNGVRSPFDLTMAAGSMLMKTPGKIGKAASDAGHWTMEKYKKWIAPNLLPAAIGVGSGVIIAPLTLGSPLIVGLAGFGIAKYLKAKGYLGGGTAAADAHGHH